MLSYKEARETIAKELVNAEERGTKYVDGLRKAVEIIQGLTLDSTTIRDQDTVEELDDQELADQVSEEIRRMEVLLNLKKEWFEALRSEQNSERYASSSREPEDDMDYASTLVGKCFMSDATMDDGHHVIRVDNVRRTVGGKTLVILTALYFDSQSMRREYPAYGVNQGELRDWFSAYKEIDKEDFEDVLSAIGFALQVARKMEICCAERGLSA